MLTAFRNRYLSLKILKRNMETWKPKTGKDDDANGQAQCGKQTRSWDSIWLLPLLSGCIFPCTGACLGSWSGYFFQCSHWALFQTSEVGIAPLDAETGESKEGWGRETEGAWDTMGSPLICLTYFCPLSKFPKSLTHSQIWKETTLCTLRSTLDY